MALRVFVTYSNTGKKQPGPLQGNFEGFPIEIPQGIVMRIHLHGFFMNASGGPVDNILFNQ